MKKYEYCTKLMDANGLFDGNDDVEEFDQQLNYMGRRGWELVESTVSNQSYGYARKNIFIGIFKRELI